MMLGLEFDSKAKDLFRSFRALLAVDKIAQFSSDNFRQYNLDRFVEDKQHGIGGLFAVWKHEGLIKIVGEERSILPSNNMRFIHVYVLTAKGAAWKDES